jgi:hypothetical protein
VYNSTNYYPQEAYDFTISFKQHSKPINAARFNKFWIEVASMDEVVE